MNYKNTHFAVDNVESEENLSERTAAEPPDDTVLSTTNVIVFKRIGDIRHFANNFPDNLAPKNWFSTDASDMPLGRALG